MIDTAFEMKSSALFEADRVEMPFSSSVLYLQVSVMKSVKLGIIPLLNQNLVFIKRTN